jgi:signal transduction histidine kinase
MSLGLKETNQKLMNHLHALANLYSISLSLHAIGSREDIFGEVSQGVAQLLDVKQCGVMLLEGEEFRHQWPAVGLSRQEAETLHVPKEKMQRCYHSTRRKALILNEGISAAPTAEAEAALKVRNLMFVWIRHRGKLVGAIRVANKNKGEFTEEDVRLMAILANNLAVALENARLYESLRERMRQLQEAQEQLVQAAKLAAIGELASNVAHEINNPLTSILGYAELIREETDLESIRRDVEIIEKESLRARDIVHQLLEFARKRPLEMAQEDVNALLQSVLELLSVQLKDTRVQVQKELQPLPPITADGNQLKQVFLNIINNALDAMQGEGVLKVRTFTASGMVCVQICDTGKGIPQEVLPRIFEPFFTTKKEKGTGLGLPISYKIVQAHKGHIDVRSETGRGSCFTVRLPMAPGGASFRTEAADSAQA